MSRIDDLIRELCPNGVEHKTLGEVGEFIRGNGLQKSDLRDVGVPAVHYGQIHTFYGVWATETKSFTDEDIAAKLRHAEPGDLLIATTSEDDDAVAKATAWLGDSNVVLSGDAYIYRHQLDPRYAAYLFQSGAFRSQKRKYISGTKVRRISGASLSKIRVPVPPLEIQSLVADTLSLLAAPLDALGAEVASEVDLRTKQCAHYRRLLLATADDHDQVALSDIADFFNAKAHEKLVDPAGSVALLTARFISTNGRLARYVQPDDVLTPAFEGDVALVMSDLPNGRALARTFYVDADGRFAANQRVCLLRSRDTSVLMPRFLFHVLNRNPQLLAYNNGVDQTHLKKGAIQSVRIGLPPIEQQRQIASVLDRLDAAVNDLVGSALPDEVSLRKKQYEYYRDKLLTFEELPA